MAEAILWDISREGLRLPENIMETYPRSIPLLLEIRVREMKLPPNITVLAVGFFSITSGMGMSNMAGSISGG